ncbi:MAG TPA: SUMF1/EgtB/PvdO family nonheme iron enzyme [Thermodesulfovibrionia bacterium]|nr:SUMF1/EgtB/PvdO family nonheme iron enzyme [Thermodesulfovibrionia bacterium]
MGGIDFDSAIRAFQAGFVGGAIEETTLQDIIKTSALLGQLQIHREILDTMCQLAAFMRNALTNSLIIQGGQITGQQTGTNEQIVFQLPYIKPAGEGQSDTVWETHYLRTLLSRCDSLDLSPIDRAYTGEFKPGEPCAVKVSDVFTTLYLKGVSRFPEQNIAAVIQKKDSAPVQVRKDEDKKQVHVQAIEAVGAVPCLVMLGQPGGGKSTLVNHMASQLARQQLGESSEVLPGWSSDERLLPVRIVLRHFASWLPVGTKRPDAGLVWNYLEDQLKEWGCMEAFIPLRKKLIEEGGALFFDGLDEVSETDEQAKRSLIVEAIHAFAKPLMDKCRIVITCREYAYRRGDAWHLPESEFPVVELALFEDEQIEHFTITWYSVTGRHKGWTEARCKQEALNLYDAVTHWSHLYELAQSPLLLTLMAQVHGRDGYLPDDRADLYDRAVELLLAQWENRIIRDMDGSRTVEPGLVMRLDIKTKTLKEALERVAFAAHERQEKEAGRSSQSADIPKEELREELAKELKSLDKAEVVIRYIQERAGMLHARDNRTYAFPHRTFQEYLAAGYCLMQSDFVQMLCELVKRDFLWWREIYLLAAGSIRKTPGNIVSLINYLVPSWPEGIKPDSVIAQQVMLACQALIETDFVSLVRKEQADNNRGAFTETFRRIQKWLNTLMLSDTALPPNIRAQAGAYLARLGDPRLEVMTVNAMEFCLVPAGPFWMGEDKTLHRNDTLSYDYWMSRYPVTNAPYREFVEAGGYKEASYWKEAVKDGFWKDGKVKFWQDDEPQELAYDYGTPYSLPNHPVVGVSWYEALAFVRWLNEQWHKDGVLSKVWSVVLPSEAEWEKAARCGLEVIDHAVRLQAHRIGDNLKPGLKANPNQKQKYPWGDEPSKNLANCKESGINSTSAVGCFPGGVSPYGCEDMAGNVWEWTRSLYKFEYPYKPDDGRENLEADSSTGRTMRGGSYYQASPAVGCVVRIWYNPDYRFDYRGIRCSLSPSTLDSDPSVNCLNHGLKGLHGFHR